MKEKGGRHRMRENMGRQPALYGTETKQALSSRGKLAQRKSISGEYIFSISVTAADNTALLAFS